MFEFYCVIGFDGEDSQETTQFSNPFDAMQFINKKRSQGIDAELRILAMEDNILRMRDDFVPLEAAGGKKISPPVSLRKVHVNNLTDRSYVIVAETEDGEHELECPSVFQAVDRARELALVAKKPTQITISCKDYGQDENPVICRETFPLMGETTIGDNADHFIVVKVQKDERNRLWNVTVGANDVEKSDTFGSDSAAALYVAAAVQDLLNLG